MIWWFLGCREFHRFSEWFSGDSGWLSRGNELKGQGIRV